MVVQALLLKNEEARPTEAGNFPSVRLLRAELSFSPTSPYAQSCALSIAKTSCQETGHMFSTGSSRTGVPLCPCVQKHFYRPGRRVNIVVRWWQFPYHTLPGTPAGTSQ